VNADKPCVCQFGPYHLDVRKRSLSRDSVNIPVSARNFDLLLYLVENSGRVIEHDELLDRVWAGTFVEQATLKKGISALRQILGDSTEAAFIKTIPRRGYSFIAPVRSISTPAAVQYVRETEREIVVEEYEETDEAEVGSVAQVNAEFKALPAGHHGRLGLGRRLLFVGAGILVFALAAVGFRFYAGRHTAPRFTAENIRLTKLTNNGRIVDGAAISTDGSYLLYPAVDKDGVSLWLRQTRANSASRLTPPRHGSFWGMDIAPDNSYVYYVFHDNVDSSKSGVFKIPLLGGEPQRLTNDLGGVLLSPDGKRILLFRSEAGTNLVSVDTNGGDQRQIVNIPGDIRIWNVAWTPDGAGVLLTLRKMDQEKAFYYVSEFSVANGKETVVLGPQERVIYSARWLPDRNALAAIVREPNADIRQIWEITPATGDWHRITNDNYSYKLAVPTRDGLEIATTQETRLASVVVAGSIDKRLAPGSTSRLKLDDLRPVNDAVGNYDRLGWLPENRIMYSVTENRQELIYTIGADGGGNRPITKGDDGIWLQATTNGTGQYVCFLSNRSGKRLPWRVDTEGKNLTKLTAANSQVSSARILSDGSTMIYAIDVPDGTRLVEQMPDGNLRTLTDRATGGWAVSPDGTLLAVELLDPGTGKLLTELRTLTDNKTLHTFDIQVLRRISFTPDGKALAYDKRTDDVSQIMVQPISGGEPYPLTEFVSDKIFDFEFSPDGASLALIRGQDSTDAVLIKADGAP
jgi:DNA-binding winged helix-turn-helix (wHTH) protein/Tol biopolymer transport system component